MARTQDGELLNTLQAGFSYIENQFFESTFSGLFSEINLTSEKLGKTYEARNKKLIKIIAEIAKGLDEFSTDHDTTLPISEISLRAVGTASRMSSPAPCDMPKAAPRGNTENKGARAASRAHEPVTGPL